MIDRIADYFFGTQRYIFSMTILLTISIMIVVGIVFKAWLILGETFIIGMFMTFLLFVLGGQFFYYLEEVRAEHEAKKTR